ncbi:MAG: hypothetical protein Q9191_001652 [Dirinaria sp. TL-2023a]
MAGLDCKDWYLKNSGTDEAPIWGWRVADRIYHQTNSIFVKRQCKPHEQVLNSRGDIAQGLFNWERLGNERDALEFIAKNTTIPVPRVLELSEEEGARCLTMEAQILRDNVDDFMYEVVLPQLASLRSHRLGQISGVVFAPPFVDDVDGTPRWEARHWEPKVSNVARYVYSHNDLAKQNIIAHPGTLKVVSIIDWEYSGFFPEGFEVAQWQHDPGDDKDEGLRRIAMQIVFRIHFDSVINTYHCCS